MSGIYDLTLAASAAGNIAASGSLVKVYSAPQGAVQIKLDAGETYTLLEGQGVRRPDAQLFRDVQVKNVSGTSQTIKLFIGSSRFEDTRITGSVQVIDTARLLTQAQQAYGSGMGFAAAGFSRIELVNPAASGRQLVISQIAISVGAGSQVTVGFATTPGTSVAGGSTGTKLAVSTFSASVAQCYGSSAASALAGVTQLTWAGSLAANAPFSYAMKEPLIITPGCSACVTAASAAAIFLNAAFDFLDLPYP